MYLLTKNKIRSLLKEHQSPCISIYMPTHQKGSEVEQDPIRFKNMMKQAENTLQEKGFQEAEINNLLKPANDLLNDSYFWSYQSDGLAVFLSPEDFHYYRLPLSFDEHAIVTNRFFIKPLIPLMAGEVRYYVLALNLNEIKLYQGSDFSLNEIRSDDIPKSIEEILKYDDPEKQLQFHTGTGAQKGRRAAMFHGQGVGKNDTLKKNSILRFFQAVDKGVMSELAGENSPLVLVGVDYLISIYKEANAYPHLFDDAVDSNPVNFSQQELHQKTWEIIESFFQQEQKEALSQYHQLVAIGKASAEAEEIVKAAHHDRIKYLFVNLEVPVYGKYDAEHNQVDIREHNQIENEDLTDLTITQTILHNGKVYALEPEKMPDQSRLAAVFRF